VDSARRGPIVKGAFYYWTENNKSSSIGE